MGDESEALMLMTNVPPDDARDAIINGLAAYNLSKAGYTDAQPLAILVRRPGSDEVVGGLLGRTYLGCLTVERFFLPEDMRRDRLGSRVLAMAEAEARRRGCTRAVLSTIHFQAPGFYLKQGWQVAAPIECDPPGHSRFYMTKKLA